MSLKFRATQVLAPHSVVSFVEGNRVIIDHSSSVNSSLEISVSLMAVELELQCFHVLIITKSPWKGEALNPLFSVIVGLHLNLLRSFLIPRLKARGLSNFPVLLGCIPLWKKYLAIRNRGYTN
jgi:hypothetical protein